MRALDQLGAQTVDDGFKGIPLGASLALRDVGTQGWTWLEEISRYRQ